MTGVILGSGLHKLTEEIQDSTVLFEDNNSFHKCRVIGGKFQNKDIIMFSGRKHYYEGYDNHNILQNINLAKEFGVKRIIITNAAGGLNSNFQISDLMLIKSHLEYPQTFGYSMGHVKSYKKTQITELCEIALNNGINLHRGTYCKVTGPAYETNADIIALKKIGVDAVGMSTIPEIKYASTLNMETVAISCITNLVKPNMKVNVSHEEVETAGLNAYNNLASMIKLIVNYTN